MSVVKKIYPGQAAPDFVLLDQDGLIHSLQQYRGQWLILYFYPKDHTPGCIREATGFRDAMRDLNKHGARVLGVNMDEQGRHAEFAAKHQLPFSLLSDEDGSVCRLFGAIWGIGRFKIVRRKTYIINPAGIVVRIYQRVNPRSHGEQVIQDLKLQQTLVLGKTG